MLAREIIDLMKDMYIFPAVLGTTDGQNVNLAFITWVYPKDEENIVIAVSSNSKSAKNMLIMRRASLFLAAFDTALSLNCSATEVINKIENVKFPVSAFNLKIESVDNNLFPGATLLGTIPFAHVGDVKKALELDILVMEALKNT